MQEVKISRTCIWCGWTRKSCMTTIHGLKGDLWLYLFRQKNEFFFTFWFIKYHFCFKGWTYKKFISLWIKSTVINFFSVDKAWVILFFSVLLMFCRILCFSFPLFPVFILNGENVFMKEIQTNIIFLICVLERWMIHAHLPQLILFQNVLYFFLSIFLYFFIEDC